MLAVDVVVFEPRIERRFALLRLRLALRIGEILLARAILLALFDELRAFRIDLVSLRLRQFAIFDKLRDLVLYFLLALRLHLCALFVKHFLHVIFFEVKFRRNRAH